jgi:hypothetical protein
LQFPSVSGNLLSEREVVPDSQEQRDDVVKSVINRNHRNQSSSATTQAVNHLDQFSPNWTDYSDYANESVSVYWSHTQEPDPQPPGVAMQHLAAAEALLS